MLIWGSGGGHALIGPAGTGQCDNCSAVRPFNFGVNYRYAHLWYLFSFLTRREYVRLCSVCDRGTKVSRDEALDNGGTEAIPFLRRWGWTIGAVLVAVIAVVGTTATIESNKRIDAYLAQPNVGDVYLADISRVTPAFSRHPVYGLMKITVIKPGSVTVVVANSGYDRIKGARRDFNSSTARGVANYFDTSDPIELSSAKLRELRSAIDDIAR